MPLACVDATISSTGRRVSLATNTNSRTILQALVVKHRNLLMFGKTFRMDGLEIVNIGENAVAHGDIAILPSLAVHP